MKSIPTKLFLTIIALISLAICGCKPGTETSTHNLVPINISMIINGGQETTNDTLLRVQLGGDFIHRMIVSDDSLFRNASWQSFDSLLFLPVQPEDGDVGVYGRFAAEEGGTTAVYSDHITLDLTARITLFNAFGPNDTLHTGDAVEFEVLTGESGTVEVAFGRYFSSIKLNEVSTGSFGRTIYVPAGINDDSVFSTAWFTDEIGNRSEPLRSTQSYVVAGRQIAPQLESTLGVPGMGSVCLLYRNGYCFISDYHSKIHLIDIQDFQRPTYIRMIETNGWCGGMDADDRLLYLADGEPGVAILGIFPAYSASIIGRALIGDRSTDVEMDGHNIYVSTYLSGLYIIDANDWIRPEVVAHLQIAGNGEDIIRNEKILYITGSPSVACVDVTDPRNPQLLSEFTVEGDVLDGIFYENKLYLATDTRGIVIYDVSDPRHPQFHSEHFEFTNTSAISVMAPYILIGRGSRITIVNGAVPDLLPIVGDFGGMRGVASIAVDHERMFIAGEGGFYTATLFR